MELIQNFGIDPKMLTAQVINFLVILYLLRRFLYKPVLDLLEKRKKLVQEGVENAQKAQVLLDKTIEEEKTILKKAQEEGKKLVNEARNQQVEIIAETEKITKKQAETILAEARLQIAFEAKETEKRLASRVSELAILFLQKSLTGAFGEKEQDEIMKNAMKKMKKETRFAARRAN